MSNHTTPGDRFRIFSHEIGLFEKLDAYSTAIWLLTKAPEYFFHIPASSTGKYHPEFTKGEGGLVKHTQAAINIAVKLWPLFIEAEPQAEPYRDEVILALMFHDVLKKGLSCTEHTQEHHAEESAQWVLDTVQYMHADHKPSDSFITRVTKLMRTHMGQWGHTHWEQDDLLLATLQHYVHLCDHISSQSSFLHKIFNTKEFARLDLEPLA